MATQITIVGLGQIGASVGLALQKQGGQFQRVGHDREPGQANKAQKMGAVDKVAFNLPSVVKDADIVFLALPLSEVRDMLALIAPDLKEGAVVLDSSPVRAAANAWAQELLPAGRYFVGFTPMLNPLFLYEFSGGTDSAHADLFDHGMVAITAPPRTASAAVKLATDLAELVGAKPLFADVAEVDSYMAATHLLPQLLAASLANATVNRAGWQEGRKFAGRAYTQVSGGITAMDTPTALAAAALLNYENITRVLDGLIAEIEGIKQDVLQAARGDLEKRLEQARKGRAQWWAERAAANWEGGMLPEPDYSQARNLRNILVGRQRGQESEKEEGE